MYKMYCKYNEHFNLTQNFSSFIVRINIKPAKLYMFDLFMSFVDRYFLIQHSFSIQICMKNIHGFVQA